jgi:nitrogen-specific signal transduction histidine kinase/CheY-like chemotaxis protein
LVARLEQMEEELSVARDHFAALIPGEDAGADERWTAADSAPGGGARSARHYRAMVEASHDAFMTLDGELRLLSGNPAATLLVGRPVEQLVGAELPELLSHQSAAALTGLLWSGFAGVGESDLELDDGRRLSFSIARLDDGRTLLVLRDVTRSHQLEREALRSRRLASVGRLAAGLAQEITTPLSIIQGRIGLLVARAHDPEAVARQARVISEHCRRVHGVIQNLQCFVAPRPPMRSWHRVDERVAAARRAAGRKLDRISLEVSIDPEDLRVHADPDQVVQLLSNLLTHVAERAAAGGRVGLICRSGNNGEVHFDLVDETGVIQPEVLAELRSPYSEGVRQFDPGLGLGLAIAWALCQDHGGWMAAEPREPTGVSYRLAIPLPVQPTRPARGASILRILVVDDDQLLCETVTWMLAEEGHNIEAVASGEEALTRLGRDRFDAILVDIGLPGMSGEDLLETIAERWPALAPRTVVTSGLLHKPRRGEAYLQKPFTRAQLLQALDRVARPEDV